MTGLTNGNDYSFVVVARTSTPGVADGDESDAVSAKPFGAPIISNVQSNPGDNSITFTWDVDDNGSTVTSCDNMPDGCGAGHHSWTKGGLDRGQTWSGSWTYRNKASGGGELVLRGTTNAPPVRTVTLSKGEGVAGTGNNGCSVGTTCHKLHVAVRNFGANASYSASCYDNGSSSAYHTTSLRTNGAGNFDGDLGCYSGYDGTRASVDGVFSNFVDFR